MSMTVCKGNGVYLVEKDDDGFEVHLRVDLDIKGSTIDITDVLWRRVSGALSTYSAYSPLRIGVARCNDGVCFYPSDSTSWTKLEAERICEIVKAQNAQLSKELRFKKRVRQVRDALNKCKDAQKIKQIANILGV